MAHLTFWRQSVVQKLAAVLAHETPPSFVEHDLHHGGEISLILGMHRLAGIEL